MSSSIFKAYDIRGIYPDEIDEDLAFRVGQAIVITLGMKAVAIGRDNRTSSPSLFRALAAGIAKEGGKVTDLGLIDTPMLYFASAKLPVDGAIMITASHNPPEYNGVKICRVNAVPVGLSSGLDLLRDTALLLPSYRGPYAIPEMRQVDISPVYYGFLASFAEQTARRFHIVTDTANAMGVCELPLLHRLPNVTVLTELHAQLGAPTPHVADPAQTETLLELQHTVRRAKADMGIAFDGDADRIGIVDELGHVVPPDVVMSLLSRVVLAEHPIGTVLYDLRFSQNVKEEITRLGGMAIETKPGHANIKHAMREHGAIFAGEPTMHFYFNEGGYCAEMGSLAAILLMGLMSREGKTLSELTREIPRYHQSGEINFRVRDPKRIFETLRNIYQLGTISELDGLKITFPGWWFSLRASNTEPVMRLNIEANLLEDLELRKGELIGLINAQA